MSFSKLAAVKKYTIFGAAHIKLGLSCFVRALRSQRLRDDPFEAKTVSILKTSVVMTHTYSYTVAWQKFSFIHMFCYCFASKWETFSGYCIWICERHNSIRLYNRELLTCVHKQSARKPVIQKFRAYTAIFQPISKQLWNCDWKANLCLTGFLSDSRTKVCTHVWICWFHLVTILS